MSITNLMNKIKSKVDVDTKTIIIIIVIIFVGGASFGLGRLSQGKAENDSIIIENKGQDIGKNNEEGYNDLDKEINENKRFVASKNGTKYYSLDCGGANRIKPENQVWFRNREEAEKSGFTFSSTCK